MKHKTCNSTIRINMLILAETYLWPDINKVDFSKCQRCHKRKSPIYDKRYKSSISSICKKCLKEFYG